MSARRKNRENRVLELTTMSVNVRNHRSRDEENRWELRRDLLFEVIRRYEPDLVGTQEAYWPQVEQLREALPEYGMVGAGRDDGFTEGETCALFYRRDRFQAVASGTFWFSDTPDVPGSRQWTPAHARICTWARLIKASGRGLCVYNVHLDHESQSARERSVRLLLDRIVSSPWSDPVIVMGDFNMDEANEVIKSIEASASPRLYDTFRAVCPDAIEVATYHGFTGRRIGEKIDYIYASPHFVTLDARIVRDDREGRYPSDHFPIVATVRLDQGR